jgi:hypothetical protein
MIQTCRYCNKPIKDEEDQYTGSNFVDPLHYAHWDCRERYLNKLDADLRQHGLCRSANKLMAMRRDPLSGMFGRGRK